MVVAYENALAEREGRNETKAKISGFLKKLQSDQFFFQMASYLDILEATGPASLVFEGDGAMPYALESTIECASFELEDLAEYAGTDEELFIGY